MKDYLVAEFVEEKIQYNSFFLDYVFLFIYKMVGFVGGCKREKLFDLVKVICDEKI